MPFVAFSTGIVFSESTFLLYHYLLGPDVDQKSLPFTHGVGGQIVKNHSLQLYQEESIVTAARQHHA